MARPKIEVRKIKGKWWVKVPVVGFGGELWREHDNFDEALGFALGEVKRRTAPTNLYASTSLEGWGPWTLKMSRQ